MGLRRLYGHGTGLTCGLGRIAIANRPGYVCLGLMERYRVLIHCLAGEEKEREGNALVRQYISSRRRRLAFRTIDGARAIVYKCRWISLRGTKYCKIEKIEV